MLNNVILGWIIRRALEIGGLVGTAVLGALSLWNSLPPAAQDAVMAMLSRNWEGVTLGDLWPLAIAIWGYVWSFRSTVKPQVVVDGQQVPMKEMPKSAQTVVEEKARTAVEKKADRPNMLDGFLKGIFGKRT